MVSEMSDKLMVADACFWLNVADSTVPLSCLERTTNNAGDREGQQQVLRATFPGIRNAVRVLLRSAHGQARS